jgi:hypothetical protein
MPHARTTWPRASNGERAFQACAALSLALVWGLGLWLEPSPTGMGTHTVLGLPPCGMLLATGHPCPTCGVTTSFVLAAHGRFGDAFVNQPFGLIVFLLTVTGLLMLVATLTTGRSWYPLLNVYGVTIPAVALTVIALISWWYKWTTMP